MAAIEAFKATGRLLDYSDSIQRSKVNMIDEFKCMATHILESEELISPILNYVQREDAVGDYSLEEHIAATEPGVKWVMGYFGNKGYLAPDYARTALFVAITKYLRAKNFGRSSDDLSNYIASKVAFRRNEPVAV